MAGPHSAAFVPIDKDLAAMSRAVVGATDADEVFQRVAPAFGAKLEMMYI
jgi:hypothetical protein